MRIVIENSGYSLNNMGDVAMLQIAAERLSNLFLDATLCVPTADMERLARYVGGTPIDMLSGRGWCLRLIPIKYAWLPDLGHAALRRLEHVIRRRAPGFSTQMGLFWQRIAGQDVKTIRKGLRCVSDADMILATGGGYLTDTFSYHALQVLDTLDFAQTTGMPTALLGQGVGPVKDPLLLACMRKVLPRAELIALREGLAGVQLLRSLGVSEDKIVVTGDDAVELAYRQRPRKTGSDIGINLRLARYSEIGNDDAQRVASILCAAARRRQTALRPIPIDWRAELDSDVGSLRLLLNGQPEDPIWPEDDTPLAVIRQIGQCRIVVSGSYHAGVFALAQGIPVVCLARSKYYMDKFMGLADQFGCGCRVLPVDNPDFERQLVAAIDETWQTAADIRPALLESAERQIAAARDAYQRLKMIVH